MSQRQKGLAKYAVALALLMASLAAGSPVRAADITVNTELDIAPVPATGIFPTDGLCSLRAAITSSLANTNTADADCSTGLGAGVLDTIHIDPSLTGETLTLAAALGPLPNINNAADNELWIIGPTTSAADFAISGGDVTRILELGFLNVGSAHLKLANLTIKDGNGVTATGGALAAVNGDGGAIYAGDNTNLTLDNVVLRDNSVVNRGGAIWINSGTITNNGGAYVGNHADDLGGAIFAFNGPTVFNGYALLMDGNTSGKGGAIAMNADPGFAKTHLERSLLINNSATSGGVFYGEPTITTGATTVFELHDSTAYNNSATNGGVFFGLASNQRFEFLRDTFVSNSATGAGGLYSAGGGFIANSIVKDSGCSNTPGMPTGSRNLWGGTNTGCGTGFGNLGAPTGLAAALAQNGGPEVQKTFALDGTSNAIDNGNNTYCGTIDARSVPRGINGTGAVNSPQTGDCDIGAYEYARYIVNFVTGTSTAQEDGGTQNVQVKLAIPDPANSPLAAALTVPITRDPASTARATIDYAIPPAGVTFPAGSVNGTIVNLPVTLVDDDIAERFGELVTFHLQAAGGAAIAEPNSHDLTIQDSDQAGVITSDGGNGTTVPEADTSATDSISVRLQSRPDYSQPDPLDSNSYGPPADVLVSVEPDRDCTATVGSETATPGDPLTFTILNDDWQDEHPITVNAVEDPWDEDLRVETAPHTCTLLFSFTSGDPIYAATIDRYDVNILDNDVNGVTIAESSGTTSLVEGGATDTYTIVLLTPPDPGKPVPATPRAATVITADPDAQCDVGDGPGVAKAFSFNGSNWATPQTVTVTAVDDPTVELDHSCSLANLITSGDPIYNDLGLPPPFARTPAGVTGAIEDYDPPAITNDPPFVDVSSGTGGVSVAEAAAGTPDTFTVVLRRQPLTHDVTVTLTGSVDPRIAGPQVLLGATGPGAPAPEASLIVTFTPANWDVPQTVSVLAVDDDYDESQAAYPVSISAAIGSTAVGFNDPTLRRLVLDGGSPLTTLALPVAIADNDVSAVVVTESGGATDVTEAGATDTYTVELATHPYDDVSVTADPDDQCDLGSGAGVAIVIPIAPADWDGPVTVTVSAVDDDTVELGHDCTITNVAASAGDDLYDGLAGAPVGADISDDDLPRVLISTGDAVTVDEDAAATSDTYTIVLGARPDANVDVDVEVTDGETVVSDGVSVATASVTLTFTAANFSVPQSISVYAVDDAVDEADTHAGSIGHTVTSTATGFATVPEVLVDGAAGPAVAVSIADNDTAGVDLSASATTVEATEGGATDSYTIVLASRPTHAVTVSPSPDGQCTTSAALTFNPASWNTPQTITVTAVDDGMIEPTHECLITHAVTSEDPGYDALLASDVTASIVDDDVAGVSITAGTLTLNEGTPATTASYTVVLENAPASDVTVRATISDGQATLGAGSATTLDLTFTPANWSTAQTITVHVVDDAAAEPTPHDAAITHSVISSAPGYGAGVGIRLDGAGGNIVTIDVADDDGPTAVDDAATTREDQAVVIAVLGNDVNGGSGALAVGSFDPVSLRGGAVTTAPGGSVRYAPPANFNGTDSFRYRASNGNLSGFATVTVTVQPVNDPPTFASGGNIRVGMSSGAYSAPWATSISAGPGESAQTVSFVIASVSAPSMFSSAPHVSSAGALAFTPVPGAWGTATVALRLVDNGGTASGGQNSSTTVSFQIVVNARPTVVALGNPTCTSSVPVRAVLPLTLADADGAVAGLTLIVTTSNSTLVPVSAVTTTGSGGSRVVRIAPQPGRSGRATIDIQAFDGLNRSAILRYTVIVGTAGSNALVGTAGRDVMFGLGGHDRLDGGGGRDLICGGPGNDVLLGGDSHDVLFGEGGNDFLAGGYGDDRLFGGSGNDDLFGEAGADTLHGGAGIDRYVGGPGIDDYVDLPGRR